MNKQSKTMRLTLMGLFAAVLLLMAYTPLGYLNIGPLAITFNVIPVALAAITLGSQDSWICSTCRRRMNRNRCPLRWNTLR